MKAVILAAGEGTRLRPFTMSRPKGMIPVGNRPILEFIVEALVQNGVKDMIMVVGYRKDTILSHFEDGRRFDARIQYVNQDKQLGTAHALSLAAKHLNGEDFLTVAGDNLIDGKLIADLLAKKKGSSLVVTESEIPAKYGVVQIKDGRINNIVEKPEVRVGNVINTGVYYFKSDIMKLFCEQTFDMERGITQILAPMISRLDFTPVKTKGKWIDAVYPWDLLNINSSALEFHGQGINGTVENGVTIKGAVSIGKGSRIRSGSYIEGPVAIGEGCDIGPNVTIMPSTSIGNGVIIGPYTYVDNCLIMSSVRIGSHSHLSHSVLDDGVKVKTGLSATTGCSYARVDREVFKLPDVGALIGQDTLVGARVVVSSGTVIGAGCQIADGVKVSVNLENNSVVV